MQNVCNTFWDAGKGNLTAQNTRKPFGGRSSAPDPAQGAYSAPTNPLVGGEGLAAPFPGTPSPLSALRVSPLLPRTPKLVPTPLVQIFDFKYAVTLTSGVKVRNGQCKCHRGIQHIWLPVCLIVTTTLSRVVSDTHAMSKNIVTMKSGSQVTQWLFRRAKTVSAWLRLTPSTDSIAVTIAYNVTITTHIANGCNVYVEKSVFMHYTVSHVCPKHAYSQM